MFFYIFLRLFGIFSLQVGWYILSTIDLNIQWLQCSAVGPIGQHVVVVYWSGQYAIDILISGQTACTPNCYVMVKPVVIFSTLGEHLIHLKVNISVHRFSQVGGGQLKTMNFLVDMLHKFVLSNITDLLIKPVMVTPLMPISQHSPVVVLGIFTTHPRRAHCHSVSSLASFLQPR